MQEDKLPEEITIILESAVISCCYHRQRTSKTAVCCRGQALHIWHRWCARCRRAGTNGGFRGYWWIHTRLDAFKSQHTRSLYDWSDETSDKFVFVQLCGSIYRPPCTRVGIIYPLFECTVTKWLCLSPAWSIPWYQNVVNNLSRIDRGRWCFWLNNLSYNAVNNFWWWKKSSVLYRLSFRFGFGIDRGALSFIYFFWLGRYFWCSGGRWLNGGGRWLNIWHRWCDRCRRSGTNGGSFCWWQLSLMIRCCQWWWMMMSNVIGKIGRGVLFRLAGKTLLRGKLVMAKQRKSNTYEEHIDNIMYTSRERGWYSQSCPPTMTMHPKQGRLKLEPAPTKSVPLESV